MMGFLYEEGLVLMCMSLLMLGNISLLYIGRDLLDLQCAEGQITSANNMRPGAYMGKC